MYASTRGKGYAEARPIGEEPFRPTKTTQFFDKLRDHLLRIGVVLIVCLVIFLAIARGIFASPDTARRALETQGFSDIEITDHAWFMISLRGGDKNDAARFKAKATNPAGKRVEVYVFTGWPFKGGTIRTP
ncbi:hypothetical protein KW782_02940 [Candidatus Parcubacteria bacterium]|nr:hypothetical protein [Candidatus Parcubacteria bacterium]